MKSGMDSGSGNMARDLNERLTSAGLHAIRDATLTKFESYLALIERWNGRINLTAIREPEVILSRHFVESIACAQFLPRRIESLLDFGSGAGFPGIPIALCRPELSVTLAESQTKKAAFLQESVRTLGLRAEVWTGRGEELDQVFDCVVLRAVDRMDRAIADAAERVRPGGWLGLLITRDGLTHTEAAGPEFQWQSPQPLPGSRQRVFALASKAGNVA